MQKSPAKAAVAIIVAKRLEVMALCHTVVAVADFAMVSGGVRESCFLRKKVAKWFKRPKDC
jgi:hypothetical protein